MGPSNNDLKIYNESLKWYDENWKLLNEHLYSICKKTSMHNELDKVILKLWIISRIYNTGIERSLGKNNSLLMLANHIKKSSKYLDGIFYKLSDLKEPLTKEKVIKIAKEHWRINKISWLTKFKNGKKGKHR